MRRPFVLAVIALSSTSCLLPARGQEAGALPKAETVLAQFVEATGGKAAYEKYKNRVVTGTIEITGANVEGKVQIFQAAPNLFAVVTNIGPVGKTTQVTDGKSAWESSSITGERVLEGAEKDAFLREATYNKELHMKDLYDKIECTATEDVDGKPAYKLVLTPKTGKPVNQWYDKTTHLLVKESTVTTGPMGEFAVEVFPSDYKRVDGLSFPFTATQKVLSQEIIIKVKEIKHDVDIPADTFRRPAPPDAAEKKKAD